MYRLLGDNHVLEGLPFSAQEFLRALEGVRSRLAAEAGVTGLELRALSRVAQESGVDPATLGEFLELSTPAVDTVIDDLVDRGLMSRTNTSPDRADAALVLTQAGHATIAGTYSAFQHSINEAASTLGSDRLFGLESGMLKMARRLDSETATHGTFDS